MDTASDTASSRAPGPPDAPAAPPSNSGRWLARVWTVARIVGALVMFIGALQILKTGAGGLAVLQGDGFLVRNAGSTLGLGWIGAMLTLSGSPVAATGLTLRAQGQITEAEGFTMVTGGRIGAAFVVLLVAVVFAARREEGKRLAPISTAVMALVITAAIYVPGAAIGLLLLGWDRFQAITLQSPPGFANVIDVVYGGVLDRIANWPPAILFIGGVALLVASFKLLDSMLPEVDEARLGGPRLTWLRRKWPMYGLGIVVTIATMSVSVALTVLVPLVGKGYVKREDLIPYIVGADIGTLIDKLLIAFLVGAGSLHPASPVRIILAEIIGTALIGTVIIAFFYTPFRRAIWRFQRQVVKSKFRLAVFTAALFATPLTVILISGVI